MQALDVHVPAVSPDGEEGEPLVDETPQQFVVRLSLEKARSATPGRGPAIVLGADTAVVLDGEVLGKPTSGDEAVEMLRRLRGRTHTVLTGVTALDNSSGRSLSTVKATEVTLREYSEAEIEDYVASGEPLDKAGGYAVQDDRFHPAQHVAGCYLNAVGLPLCEVVRLLDDLGAPIALKPGWMPPAECVDCPLTQRQKVLQA